MRGEEIPLEVELETLIRARYPILYLVTAEEGRAVAMLRRIGERRQKQVYEWSATGGVMPSGGSLQSQKHRNSPTRDPLAALDYVIDLVEPALFLFKDLHPWLTKGHPAVVRRLKEIALEFKNSLKTVVLISPVLEVPVELEKEMTVLRLPLPTAEELGGLMDGILGELRELRRLDVRLEGWAREKLLQAARGLTLTEAENVFAKILVQSGGLSAENVPEVLGEKKQIVRKSGLLEYHETGETLEHVGGLGALKRWLGERAAAWSPEARAFGLPPPRGMLLLGVQGCGKSLCAKAISNGWQLPLLRFDMGRMFGSLVGSSEENVRRAIHVAESVAPAILWVDEVDKAFAGSRAWGASDAGTSARVFGTFLTWLSEKEAPVFVVATANEIAQLPPELMRKGRLDEIFFVDLPTPEERREIFRIHIARRGRDPEAFDLGVLAGASEGYSGAEIEQSVVSALYRAFARRRELSMDFMEESLRQGVPLSRTMQEQIHHLRMWAEGRARSAHGDASEMLG